MWWKTTSLPEYTTLRNSSDDSIAGDSKLESYLDSRRLRRREFLLNLAPWLAHFVFFLVSSTLLFRAARFYEKSNSQGEVIARELPQARADVGSRSPRTFEGQFFARTKYRGDPSPEVDAEWEKLYNTGAMAISRTEMLRIQKLVPSSVELPEEPEESYQAGLEVFHQIHCLDMIRRYTYFEYYSVAQPDFARPMTRIHIDHCIEMLRQSLMCDSDLHAYTYNWVDRVDHSWPDFSTTKMCRNFDDVLAWGKKHAAHTSAKEGMLRRPENASVLHIPSDDELSLQ